MVGAMVEEYPSHITFVKSNSVSSSDGLFHRQGRSGKNAIAKSNTHTVSFNNENSMQRSMSALLVIGQCFSLCPVQGITSHRAEDLRFTWRSYRVLYAWFIIIIMIMSVGFVIHWLTHVGFNFKTIANLIFYVNGLVCCILFFRIGMLWPKLGILWQRVERTQLHYGYPKNLNSKIKRITVFILVVAIVEHAMSHLYQLHIAYQCSNGAMDLFKHYLVFYHSYLFDIMNFSPFFAAFSAFANFMGVFYWNFPDLFLITISIALSSRLTLLNKYLKDARGKIRDEKFWRGVREDYGSLSFLTKALDSCISSLMLFSFASDLFYLCLQLLYSLNNTNSTVQEIYIYMSCTYLAVKTTVKSLCAAKIQEESQLPKDVLYSVPAGCYCSEVIRFLDQISTDNVVLTGLKFFPVTRMVLLTLAGTIVTYEIVLVQFGTAATVKESTNLTALCLNKTEHKFY